MLYPVGRLAIKSKQKRSSESAAVSMHFSRYHQIKDLLSKTSTLQNHAPKKTTMFVTIQNEGVLPLPNAVCSAHSSMCSDSDVFGQAPMVPIGAWSYLRHAQRWAT